MILALNSRLNKVERRVVRALRGVDNRYLSLGRKDPKWTRAIKNAVGGLGKSKGFRYDVYASQCKFEGNGEWMFDLVWSRDHENMLIGLPLVMESEWEPREILWDFAKLVAARADLR